MSLCISPSKLHIFIALFTTLYREKEAMENQETKKGVEITRGRSEGYTWKKVKKSSLKQKAMAQKAVVD